MSNFWNDNLHLQNKFFRVRSNTLSLSIYFDLCCYFIIIASNLLTRVLSLFQGNSQKNAKGISKSLFISLSFSFRANNKTICFSPHDPYSLDLICSNLEINSNNKNNKKDFWGVSVLAIAKHTITSKFQIRIWVLRSLKKKHQ